MEIDDFQLVELVRKNNVIYDKNHGQHKNKHARYEAFKNIGAILGAPADLCETRWSLLRNRFCLELRHSRGSVNPSDPPRRPWILFDSMKFLAKFIFPRKTRSMLLSSSIHRTSNPYLVKPELETSDDRAVIENEQPEEIETTPSLSLSDHTDDYRNSNYENVNFPVVTSLEEDDEDILFGKMVAKYLKKIKDVDKKIQIKIEIMALFKTHRWDSA